MDDSINQFQWLVRLGLEAARGWNKHRAQRLAASLSFYTTLALAPLLMIAVAIAGRFLGDDAVRGEIVDQTHHLVGHEGALAIESLIKQAGEPQTSRIATVISIIIVLFGATGVFAELKDSLDTIWEVKPVPGQRLWTILKTQVLSFTVVVGTGCLLIVSLLLTAMLAAFTHWISQWLPMTIGMAHLLEAFVSFGVTTLLFALIFKLLPDVTVCWKDLWIGAVTTAILFTIGKILIGFYIGSAGFGSIYGAAGSLVVILVWTYYSSLIFYFGAELVRAQQKYPGDHRKTE